MSRASAGSAIGVDQIVVCGPVSWNTLVYLDLLPEPRPHVAFALEDFKTVGGTSAGKALHLAGLGQRSGHHSKQEFGCLGKKKSAALPVVRLRVG